jgi:hypothetical protein
MPFERYYAIPRSKQYNAKLYDDLDRARERLRECGGGTIQERNAKVIYSRKLGSREVVFDPPLTTWGDIEVIGVEGEDKEESKKQQLEISSDMQSDISSIIDASAYPSDSITLDHKALGHWVTGFTDGEGSFNCFKQKTGQRQIRFGIRLREDDLTSLKLVQAYWGGIGRIYGEPARNHGTHTSKPTQDFLVYDPQELLRVVEHFEEFPLLSKKAESFEIWKHVVHVKVNEKDYSNAEALLGALCEQLSSLQGSGKEG